MLTRGQLFGAITQSIHLGDVTLGESRYAPHTRTPTHAHELPNFVLVVDGGFDEQFDSHARVCGPRRLLYRPAGERHSQRFLARGSVCLTMELAESSMGELRSEDGHVDLAGVPTLDALRIYDEFRRTTTDSSLVV